MKSLFPKQEWTDFALEEVNENKLDQMAPADALEFGIDGTPESWVHLLTAMAKHESDFKPTLTYKEDDSLGGVISTGLFQMIFKSVQGYADFARNGKIKAQMKAATTEKLKDPFYNIMVAVIILKRWVVGDGVIATGSKPWLGGARYWSVLRKGAPKVKATLEQNAETFPLALMAAPKPRASARRSKWCREKCGIKPEGSGHGDGGPKQYGITMQLDRRSRLGATAKSCCLSC